MKGNTTEDHVERIKEIINVSINKTPEFIRGLLIPDRLVSELEMLLNFVCKDALLSVEYFKQINDMRFESEKATHDFMTTFCKKVADGTLIIK